MMWRSAVRVLVVSAVMGAGCRHTPPGQLQRPGGVKRCYIIIDAIGGIDKDSDFNHISWNGQKMTLPAVMLIDDGGGSRLDEVFATEDANDRGFTFVVASQAVEMRLVNGRKYGPECFSCRAFGIEVDGHSADVIYAKMFAPGTGPKHYVGPSRQAMRGMIADAEPISVKLPAKAKLGHP